MEVVLMARRVHRLSTLLAVLAVAAALVPAGSATSRASLQLQPTLYVNYAMNCTFTIHDDNGALVSSIAPGTYQVQITSPVAFAGVDLSGVSDMTACKGFVQFQLTGPGVRLSTTLQDGDGSHVVLSATFQASSTYTAQDNNQPSATATVFSTLASGSPTAPGSPSAGPPSASTSTAIRGTLVGALSATGNPTLTRDGKTVVKLIAGRYRFSINDRDSKSGFTIQQTKGGPTNLTGVKFVGKRTVIVNLNVGQWKYTGRTKSNFFTVV
jgi:hypothetical protein